MAFTVPAGWAALPEVSRSLSDRLPRGMTGGALAFGDTGRGCGMHVIWLRAAKPTRRIRADVERFPREMKEAMTAGGNRITRDASSDERGCLVSRTELVSTSAGGGAAASQVAACGVTRDGTLRAWIVQCVWNPASQAACARSVAAALASFRVTLPADRFQPLPRGS